MHTIIIYNYQVVSKPIDLGLASSHEADINIHYNLCCTNQATSIFLGLLLVIDILDFTVGLKLYCGYLDFM